MSKRDNRRVSLSDFKDEKRREGGVEIETDDGTVFEIDPPQVWSDELLKMREDDIDGFGPAILGGAERYAEFVEKGGSVAVILALLDERHGVDAKK